MAIVGFVIFDVLAVVFLLWCLLNFIHEGRRHRGVSVKVMRVDRMLSRRKANILATGSGRFHASGVPRLNRKLAEPRTEW